jgi:hypothetical protein
VYAIVLPGAAARPATVRRLTGSMTRCIYGGDDDDDFPSRFAFFPWWPPIGDGSAGDTAREAAGAAVMTALFILASTVAVIVATPHPCASSRSDKNRDDLSVRTLVGAALLTLALTYFGPSAAEAAAYVFATSNSTIAIPSCVAVSFIIVGHWTLYLCISLEYNVFVTALSVSKRYAAAIDPIQEGARLPHLRLHRAAFAVDVAAATVMSAVAGVLRAGAGCSWLPLVAAVVALALLGYVVVVRPFEDLFELVVTAGLNGLQALLSVLTAAAILRAQGDSHRDAGSLGSAATELAAWYELLVLAAPLIIAIPSIARTAAACVRTHPPDANAPIGEDMQMEPLLSLLSHPPTVEGETFAATGTATPPVENPLARDTRCSIAL